jgi:hypothetical protein
VTYKHSSLFSLAVSDEEESLITVTPVETDAPEKARRLLELHNKMKKSEFNSAFAKKNLAIVIWIVAPYALSQN